MNAIWGSHQGEDAKLELLDKALATVSQGLPLKQGI